jgi:hypothetical protein
MDKRITFATNTANNTLEYTKLLLKSLKENLDNKHHEILVFIDSDNDGTLEYLRTIKKDFHDLKIISHKLKPVVGCERNQNLIVELAKYDIVSYLQSDMVISKHYDTNILEDLQEDVVLSSTRIEPPLHGESSLTITKNFGLNPTEFKYADFLEFAETNKLDRSENYFFAPYTFYKTTWNKIAGYDTNFRRSRCDSDMVQRFLHADVKLKQTFKANVYHFTCVSSRGTNWFDSENVEAQNRVLLQDIADKIELRRFVRKWGSFNHGECKLKKLDIDLVIDEDNELGINNIVQIEPYFSRVWFKNEQDKQNAIHLFSNEHDPANKLYGFSKEDWNESKKYYNLTDYDSIYKVGTPINFNIKIEVNFKDIDFNADPFLQNITRLGDILEGSEPGIYELGSAKIEVKNVVDLTQDQIVVNNPPFDYSLLIIE